MRWHCRRSFQFLRSARPDGPVLALPGSLLFPFRAAFSSLLFPFRAALSSLFFPFRAAFSTLCLRLTARPFLASSSLVFAASPRRNLGQVLCLREFVGGYCVHYVGGGGVLEAN